MNVRGPAIKLALFAVVTAVCTGLLAMTIGNVRLRSYHRYRAVFADVTGLVAGDDVRVAGVQSGRVQSIEVVDGRALVSFRLQTEVRLTGEAHARIRYKNLLGQRYLAISESAGGTDLEPGATIPIGHTTSALDLTALFSGFRPLFQALTPADVNRLAAEIVATLQGEGGSVDALLARTASVTSSLATRSAAIGRIIANLEAIVSTTAERDETLGRLVAELQRLTTGLAQDRDAIGESVVNLDLLVGATASLLEDSRPALDRDLRSLNSVLDTVESKKAELGTIVSRLPALLAALIRSQSYGSWINLYVCTIGIQIGDLPRQQLGTGPTPAGC